MTSAVPSEMQAITIDGNKAKISKIKVPKLRPQHVLVKVDSVALNPTDWKHISGKRAASNGISGCDFAGTIVDIGKDVTTPLKPGDRVAGVVHGANFSNPEDGAFAEYCVANSAMVFKIPESLSFEQASTLGVGTGTVGQGMYDQALKISLPSQPITTGEKVLIYGGSTATGSLGIQFAKLSGYTVLTTCSPHNNDFVKSLGADAVYDYKDPDVGKKINADTNDSLKLAWDTISLESSAKICADALSSDPSGARYGSILAVKLPREGVQSTTTLLYTAFGEAFVKGGKETPPKPEHLAFAKKWNAIVENLLAEGKIKTHPEQVGERGLVGVLSGMRDQKDDKVSAKKLVYRIRDTPKDASDEVEL